MLTIPANLAGPPALNIPTAVDPIANLPLGLQLIGDYHAESAIIDVAAWIAEEQNRSGGERAPPTHPPPPLCIRLSLRRWRSGSEKVSAADKRAKRW